MTCSILFSRHEKPISITYNLFIIYNFVIPFSASKSIASLGNKNILQKLLIQKDIFLKIYSHYNHTVNNKNSNVTKTAPQRPICSWQFVKWPSWWSLFKTSTPLFSSIKKLGSDKISSISLFRYDLGHNILRISIASLLFDASDIRPSGVAAIQGKCGWITNPATV